jgi:hypothetical protein
MDITLRSKVDLRPLVLDLIPFEAYEEVKQSGDEFRITVGTALDPASPVEAIRQGLRVVESLNAESREMWDSCHDKTFDLGFHTTRERFDSTWTFEPEILSRLSAIGAGLALTIYQTEMVKPSGNS